MSDEVGLGKFNDGEQEKTEVPPDEHSEDLNTQQEYDETELEEISKVRCKGQLVARFLG